jgi:hypothetical protein
MLARTCDERSFEIRRWGEDARIVDAERHPMTRRMPAAFEGHWMTIRRRETFLAPPSS